MNIPLPALITDEDKNKAYLDFISLHFPKDKVEYLASQMPMSDDSRVKTLLVLREKTSKDTYKDFVKKNCMMRPIIKMCMQFLESIEDEVPIIHEKAVSFTNEVLKP